MCTFSSIQKHKLEIPRKKNLPNTSLYSSSVTISLKNRTWTGMIPQCGSKRERREDSFFSRAILSPSKFDRRWSFDRTVPGWLVWGVVLSDLLSFGFFFSLQSSLVGCMKVSIFGALVYSTLWDLFCLFRLERVKDFFCPSKIDWFLMWQRRCR